MKREVPPTQEQVSRRAVLGGIGGAVITGALASTADTLAAPQAAYAEADPANTLWRIGDVNGSSSEFRDEYRQVNPEVVDLRTGWETRTWDTVSKGLKADMNPEMQILYHLNGKPQYGALLEMKIVHAHWGVPQMAVFSNGTMVGMIQIFGAGELVDNPIQIPNVGTFECHPYVESYWLYIPSYFLEDGDNTLRLKAVHSFSGTGTMENQYTWWEWDYLRLSELDALPAEPAHGRLYDQQGALRRFHLGTMIAQGQFGYNQAAIDRLQPMLEWLGIAYSANVMRVGFWSNLNSWQNFGRAYLKKLKDLNLRVVADYLSYADDENVEGEQHLTPVGEGKLNTFLNDYGPLIQFYEVDNEPVRPERVNWGIEVARYFRVAPAVADPDPSPAEHVQLVAPGWTFGTNVTWALNPDTRRTDYEDLCDLTSGHSYGRTYAKPNRPEGTSFIQALMAYEPTGDGLPKRMLVTETGNTNNTDDPRQKDFVQFGASQPMSAMFDRILRGHVAFADHVMQHAAFFENYQLFEIDWSVAPEQVRAYQFGPNNPTTRVEIFRRIACAYATHGKPLPYTYGNRSQLQNRLIYTRAVNTATLPSLKGSGGKSDKVLISVVNFDRIELTVELSVTMPTSGTWSCRRFGRGISYADARTTFTRIATPIMNLSPTLAPGEAIQFILTPPAP